MSNSSVIVRDDAHALKLARASMLADREHDLNRGIGTVGRVTETRAVERLLILLHVGHRVLRAGLQGTRSLIAGPATRNGRMRNVTFWRIDLASDADNYTSARPSGGI